MIRRALLPAILATTALAATPSTGTEIDITATGPVIELSVTETVEQRPDMVTIGAGVTTEAPTATEALRRNSDAMNRVIARLRSLGVDEDDIQTTGFNLQAEYDYNQQTRQQVFRGYRASNRVSAKLRDLDRAGAVLDALVQSGATDLSGPSFSVADDSAAKAQARANAMAKARTMALDYARSAGYGNVRVLTISEQVSGSAPMARAMVAMEAAADVGAVPLAPGQVGSSVTVNIAFEAVN